MIAGVARLSRGIKGRRSWFGGLRGSRSGVGDMRRSLCRRMEGRGRELSGAEMGISQVGSVPLYDVVCFDVTSNIIGGDDRDESS